MIYKKILLTVLYPFFECIYFFVNLVMRLRPEKNINKERRDGLIVVKLDGIGDYMLFRNFLQIIRKSKKYSGQKITFVGNIKFKDLAENMDSEFVDRFIWVDRDKIFRNPFIFSKYAISVFKNLRQSVYSELINASYSRAFLDEFFLIRSIKADHKVSMLGDSMNMTVAIKKTYDKFYDALICTEQNCVFEFDRNKFFIQKLIGEPITISSPFFSKELPGNKIESNIPYVVIFPGASKVFRQWPPESFSKIAEFIIKKYKYRIVIAGSSADQVIAEKIKDFIADNKVIDVTGKTTLPELATIIKNSKLLISNDTSAVHIAASVGANTIFFLVGNNEFGRFGPYPPRFKNMRAIYPIDLESTEETYSKLITEYKKFHKMKINDISVEKVIKTITEML